MAGAASWATVLRVVLISTSISPSRVTIACRIRRIVRRRSSSASAERADAGVVGVQRVGVQPQHGQRGTQPVGQVGDQFPLVGAGRDQPVGHPVERVPGLGQLARAARLDPDAQVAVADRQRGLDQPPGRVDRPGRRAGRRPPPTRPPGRRRRPRAAAATCRRPPRRAPRRGRTPRPPPVRSPSTTGSSRTTPPAHLGDQRSSSRRGPGPRPRRRPAPVPPVSSPCTTGRAGSPPPPAAAATRWTTFGSVLTASAPITSALRRAASASASSRASSLQGQAERDQEHQRDDRRSCRPRGRPAPASVRCHQPEPDPPHGAQVAGLRRGLAHVCGVASTDVRRLSGPRRPMAAAIPPPRVPGGTLPARAVRRDRPAGRIPCGSAPAAPPSSAALRSPTSTRRPPTSCTAGCTVRLARPARRSTVVIRASRCAPVNGLTM